jgi:hypothetical protein
VRVVVVVRERITRSRSGMQAPLKANLVGGVYSVIPEGIDED